MKICTKCNIEKPLEEFHKSSRDKSGVRSECKICVLGHEPRKPIIEGTKICKTCNIEKETEEFGNILVKNKLYKQASCKTCKNKQRTEKRKLDADKEKLRKRKQRLMAKYGLTIENYEVMYGNQEGKCFICNKPESLLHVDHCHTSGNVRGLLCSNCNVGLGNFKDNVENLLKAVEYLKLYNN